MSQAKAEALQKFVEEEVDEFAWLSPSFNRFGSCLGGNLCAVAERTLGIRFCTAAAQRTSKVPCFCPPCVGLSGLSDDTESNVFALERPEEICLACNPPEHISGA